MTPTEKHRETAEQIANDFRMIGDGCEGDLMEMIAAALAKAEREGMKRAAEIATEHAGKNGPVNEFDDDGYWQETTALTIAAAILSEAGKDE